MVKIIKITSFKEGEDWQELGIQYSINYDFRSNIFYDFYFYFNNSKNQENYLTLKFFIF